MSDDIKNPILEPTPEPDDATELASTTSLQRFAVYADAFLVSVLSDELFRLTFAEGNVEMSNRLRAAIVMPTEDARELARIINSLLAKMDAQKAAAKT